MLSRSQKNRQEAHSNNRPTYLVIAVQAAASAHVRSICNAVLKRLTSMYLGSARTTPNTGPTHTRAIGPYVRVSHIRQSKNSENKFQNRSCKLQNVLRAEYYGLHRPWIRKHSHTQCSMYHVASSSQQNISRGRHLVIFHFPKRAPYVKLNILLPYIPSEVQRLNRGADRLTQLSTCIPQKDLRSFRTLRSDCHSNTFPYARRSLLPQAVVVSGIV